ncbi:MAG: hypothetical protein HY290_31485 [Planctomycetia bacterium]|nr:hypothetical protein [Planctomycetia bacterium]
MDVSIQECPSCGAVAMGDETTCSGCGKPLPGAQTQAPLRGLTATAEEVPCPRCGMLVPKYALRCRDCGAYMNPEVEAAAMAQQANRMFTPGGSSGGLRGGGAGFGSSAYTTPGSTPAMSGFAEVADDADFDLLSEMDAGGGKLRNLNEVTSTHHDASTGAEDDFEMGDGTADYAVANEPGPLPDFTAPAPPPVPPAVAAGASAAAGSAPPVPAVDHSIQTAGDVLLDAALAEETEATKRAKLGRRRPKRTAITGMAADRILVFCPNGHRVQVQDRHRGRTGRCPNCKALFFVPVADTIQTLGQAGGQPAAPAAEGAAAAQSDAAIGYTKWITDVRLHRVNPAKLKLIPGSLEGEYESVDLGASSENLLVAVVFAGGGPFRAMQEPKKKPVTRQAMLDHLAAKKPIEELPVAKKYQLTPDLLAQLKIVQPSIPGEESLFADVPVFGKGRIAVRVAPADAPNERSYLSFTLTQFRQFSLMLAESFSLADYGSGTSIPLGDDLAESTCHYSETVLRSLPPERLEYYQADPAMKLVVLGRRCQKCGLVVSEDSRKKEKIGGKNDASIAKALCPKCKAKFGNITLFGFPPSA